MRDKIPGRHVFVPGDKTVDRDCEHGVFRVQREPILGPRDSDLKSR